MAHRTTEELKLGYDLADLLFNNAKDLVSELEDDYRHFVQIKKQQMINMQNELQRLRLQMDEKKIALEEARKSLSDAVCPWMADDYDAQLSD
jgi:ABC-type phosphate transport system auxiliary subunit